MRNWKNWVGGSFLVFFFSMIAVVFYGFVLANRRAHRAGCIMNIRNVQQGTRAYQNMNGFRPGEPGFRKDLIVGRGKNVSVDPVCPTGGTYTWLEGNFPEKGVLVIRCSHRDHVPKSYHDW